MKSKIIFSVILSAMLLTACNSEQPLVDELEETSGTTASAQAVQVVQGETKSNENEGETNYILGGETETAVSVTETTTETEPEKEFSFDVQKIDISGILEDGERFSGGIQFFANNIASIGCYSNDGGEIRFFDINDLTVKASVTAPEGWEFDGGYYYSCIKGGGDVFCKIKLSRFDKEKLKDEYAALIVYKDFTTELAEGELREIFSFPAGNHNISDAMYDIFDADSGEVIVEGFEDTETDLGFDSKWHYYMSEIDSDRFIYRTVGYESFLGFSYYDFAAGQAVDFPNSKNFLPVGYHDGKVYAEECGWASMCLGELYTFDMETLESEHFISSPAELGQNDYTEYYMPPNGEYIIASYHDEDNDDYDNFKNIIYIISPDSGENLFNYELNLGGSYISYFTFINDNSFAAQNDNEIIIFNVTI